MKSIAADPYTDLEYSEPIKALTPSPHLTAEELLQRQRHATTADERDRWFALRTLIQQPQTSRTALLEQLGRSRRWLTALIHRYNEHGPEAVTDHRKGRAGQPPVLNAEQRSALDERLQSPPDDGGEWTIRKVADWILEQTGRSVDPSTAWLYLKRLGYSRQKGRPVHPKAASQEEQIEQQKKFGPWSKNGDSSTRTNELNSGAKTKRGTVRKASSAKSG